MCVLDKCLAINLAADPPPSPCARTITRTQYWRRVVLVRFQPKSEWPLLSGAANNPSANIKSDSKSFILEAANNATPDFDTAHDISKSRERARRACSVSAFIYLMWVLFAPLHTSSGQEWGVSFQNSGNNTNSNNNWKSAPYNGHANTRRSSREACPAVDHLDSSLLPAKHSSHRFYMKSDM